MAHILDNPIYHALQTGHQVFAKGNAQANYYREDIAAFAGLKDNAAADFEQLYQQSPADSLFVIFTVQPLTIPANWKLLTHINMFQMVYELDEVPVGITTAIKELDHTHVPEMTDLVELTKPGPFKPETILLSNYTGIFKDQQLVAMAGHRFNPSPYTEVSAVCTHPDHLGKGYAYQLLQEQIRRIKERHEIPFLHVRNDNHGAVKLYEKLGFTIRTEMMAYVIQKVAV